MRLHVLSDIHSTKPTMPGGEVVTKRVLLFALALTLSALALPVWPQEPSKPSVVGVLANAVRPDDPAVEIFRKELHQLGYVEGRNLNIEFRTAQGRLDRLAGLAAELVRLNADVIVVGSTEAAHAAKRASSTIPIVLAIVPDPVASGLVNSLARPGGNITGISSMSSELVAKRLELLREAMPRISRVGVIWNPAIPGHTKSIEELKTVALSLSIKLHFVGVRTPEDFGAGFKAIRQADAQALYLIEDALFFAHRTTLGALALSNRLPGIYWTREFADAGGLMSYGMSYEDLARRSARYVDKILKGAKPADLPIEQPTRLELVVNMRTAKALGLSIPESVLVRADEVVR
jgi:putative ABC transport system substrate-binding protein